MATAAAARLTSPIWQRDAIPTGSEFYHAIAVKKLVLRVGPSLSSPKVGNVKPGTKLTALGREVVDGVLRIKVGVDTSPRGVCCSAQGWVTAEKDGEVKLRISREGAGMPSTATSTALYLRNAKSEDVVDPSFLRLGHADGSRNVSESMATRIAKRRQTWRTSGSSGSGGGGSGSGGSSSSAAGSRRWVADDGSHACASRGLSGQCFVAREAGRCAPKMLVDTRIIAAGVGGTFAGGLHAVTGPDHLAALLPLCMGRRWWIALYTGAYWGLGHGIGAGLVGALAWAVRGALNLEVFSSYMEAAVGISIMIIGVNGIRESREWATEVVAEEVCCHVSMRWRE